MRSARNILTSLILAVSLAGCIYGAATAIVTAAVMVAVTAVAAMTVATITSTMAIGSQRLVAGKFGAWAAPIRAAQAALATASFGLLKKPA